MIGLKIVYIYIFELRIPCGLQFPTDYRITDYSRELVTIKKSPEDIFWWNWSIVQWIGRLLAHCGFRLVTDSGTNANRNEAFAKFLLAWLMDFFWRIGDTKCIEETHRLGREVEQRGQQPDLLSCRVFYQLMQGLHTPLQARGVPHLSGDLRFNL